MKPASVIGRSTIVRGPVQGTSDLEILGHVEGDVTVEGNVQLRQGGSVRGNISGTQVLIAGTVQGDIRGAEQLLIEAGARIVGDLSAPSLGVSSGALIRGSVQTDDEPDTIRAARRAAAEKARAQNSQAPRGVGVRSEAERAALPALRNNLSTRKSEALRAPLRGTSAGLDEEKSARDNLDAVKSLSAPLRGESRMYGHDTEYRRRIADSGASELFVAERAPSLREAKEDRAPPPPPIVPALSKGAKAKQKKKSRT